MEAQISALIDKSIIVFFITFLQQFTNSEQIKITPSLQQHPNKHVHLGQILLPKNTWRFVNARS